RFACTRKSRPLSPPTRSSASPASSWVDGSLRGTPTMHADTSTITLHEREHALSGPRPGQAGTRTPSHASDRKRNARPRVRRGGRVSPQHAGGTPDRRWDGPLGRGLLLSDP